MKNISSAQQYHCLVVVCVLAMLHGGCSQVVLAPTPAAENGSVWPITIEFHSPANNLDRMKLEMSVNQLRYNVLPALYKVLTDDEKKKASNLKFVAVDLTPGFVSSARRSAIETALLEVGQETITFFNIFPVFAAAANGGTLGMLLNLPVEAERYYRYLANYNGLGDDRERAPTSHQVPDDFFSFINADEIKQGAMINKIMAGSPAPWAEFDAARSVLQEFTFVASIAFIFAHEIGHVIHEDLKKDVSSSEEYRKIEYDADAFAAEILSRLGIDPGLGQLVLFLTASLEDIASGRDIRNDKLHDFADCRWFILEREMFKRRIKRAKELATGAHIKLTDGQADRILTYFIEYGEAISFGKSGLTASEGAFFAKVHREVGSDTNIEDVIKQVAVNFLEREQAEFLKAKSYIINKCDTSPDHLRRMYSW